MYIWEWSIHYTSLSVMFTLSHSRMNQELLEKYVCNQSTHYEKCNVAMHPSYRLKLKYSFPFSVTHYTAVRINNCLKSTSVVKVATMKNTDNLLRTVSVAQRKPSHATTTLTLFTVSKNEWNTKEDSGKSLKNALDVLQYANRHLPGWKVKKKSNP